MAGGKNEGRRRHLVCHNSSCCASVGKCFLYTKPYNEEIDSVCRFDGVKYILEYVCIVFHVDVLPPKIVEF